MLSRFLTSPTRLGMRRMSESIANSKNSISGVRSASGSSVDHEEVLKFTKKSAEWWSSYEALRLMNAVRVPFIRDGLLSISQSTVKNPLPLKGYEIIDVGCGGGILSESLARLGASVTGLDPGPENIEVAIDHASEDHEIKDRLTYVCDSIENLAATNAGKYDAVVCSEVIEHVADVHSFVNSCVEVTKDGGSLFFTTINRTLSSYLLAIIGAEYVLRIIPTGTHDWNKFITPEELSEMLQSLNCRTVSVDGMMYNPIFKTWSFTNCHDFYALHACKNE